MRRILEWPPCIHRPPLHSACILFQQHQQQQNNSSTTRRQHIMYKQQIPNAPKFMIIISGDSFPDCSLPSVSNVRPSEYRSSSSTTTKRNIGNITITPISHQRVQVPENRLNHCVLISIIFIGSFDLSQSIPEQGDFVCNYCISQICGYAAAPGLPPDVVNGTKWSCIFSRNCKAILTTSSKDVRFGIPLVVCCCCCGAALERKALWWRRWCPCRSRWWSRSRR
jgi:hypothetical protein